MYPGADVTDWEAVALWQLAAAWGMGGGVYYVPFRSERAEILATFAFVTFGGGGGGHLTGTNLPFGTPDELPDSAWTPVRNVHPFSAQDLNHCFGIILTGGVSVYAGWSGAFFWAWGGEGRLFSRVFLHGWGTGIGASGLLGAGLWHLTGMHTYKRKKPAPTKPVLVTGG